MNRSLRLSTRLSRTALAVAAVSIFAGCGSERGETPNLAVLGSGGDVVEFTSSRGEVSFRHPSSWSASDGVSPQVAQLASGGALVSIYAYPRDDLGKDPAGVRAARDRIIESLRERAPGFLVTRTRIGEVDTFPSVEIRGRGTIDGKPVESRSTHVYVGEDIEWVIDAYARPRQFEQANRIAFGPLLSSIELSFRVPAEDDDPGTGA